MSFASSTQPQVVPLTGRDTELASLGSYFVASTPTPGTGVISGTPTSLVATTPYLVLYNGGSVDVHLHYLRLMETVAGSVDAVTRQFTHFIDQGNRYASGGTGLTIKNTNALSNAASNAVATVGVVTATAASGNQRQIGNDWFRVAVTDKVGDVLEWDFGGRASSTGSTPSSVCHFVHQMPPIVLPPNTSYVLNVWSGTFTTGITFEVSMGFSER